MKVAACRAECENAMLKEKAGMRLEMQQLRNEYEKKMAEEKVGSFQGVSGLWSSMHKSFLHGGLCCGLRMLNEKNE